MVGKDLRRKKCGRKGAGRRRMVAEPLEDRRLLATVVWDGGGDGVNWADPLNWDANQLPATGDDVVIDSAFDPTIQYDAGTLSLGSLTSNEALHLAGGSLTITGAGQINANFTAGQASLIASGPAASIQATTSTSLFQTTLKALGGGAISIPATMYTEGNSTLEADGAGSLLDLSSLTTMSGGGFIRTVFVEANNGGVVDLSSLAEVTGGATRMIVDGAGSRIDASSLTTFTDTNGNRSSEINVANAGHFDAPSLTNTSAVYITLDANANMSTSQLLSVTAGKINVSGTTRDFNALTDITDTDVSVNGGATVQIPNVTTIDQASFSVQDGATLTVPSATSYAEGSSTLEAIGPGSVLDLSNVTTMSGGGFTRTVVISAENGGFVDLGSLTEITGGATLMWADGVGSKIDATSLTTFTDNNGNRRSEIIPSNGGEFDAPNLVSTTAVWLELDATATMATSQLTSMIDSDIVVTGVTRNFSGLVDITNTAVKVNGGATVQIPQASAINGASFYVYDAATLMVPAATSFVGQSQTSTRWHAEGAGSRLEFPALTTASGGSFIARHEFEAVDGGVVDVSLLAEITGGATEIMVDGTGSGLNVPLLTTLVDTNGNVASVIDVTNAGQLNASQLSSLDGINVNLGTGATIATPQMTSYTGGTVTVNATAADFSGLTEITNSRFVLQAGGTVDLNNATSANGSSFEVYDGVTLALPAVTSYSGQSQSGTRFLAVGPGSRVEFPAITTFSGGVFISRHDVEAAAGGVVDFSALTQITGGSTKLAADGVGSLIALPVLTSFADTEDNVSSLLTATNQGEVDAPLLTSLSAVNVELNALGILSTSQWVSTTAGSITVDSTTADLSGITDFTHNRLTLNAGGTADLANAASIDGASFYVNDGVSLSLPSATSYVGQSQNDTVFRASGAGSALDLSTLTTASGGSFISRLWIEALGGGTVDLSNTSGITGGATRVVADAGTVDLAAATQFNDTNGNRLSTIYAENGGNVLLNPTSISLSDVTTTLTTNGAIHAGSFELLPGSVVDGTGTLNANLVNGGIVRPGLSPGVQTILGDYMQLPGGTLEVEIGGLVAQSEHDQLIVMGSATLGGTLDIALINGFEPTELDAFEIIDHQSSSGAFASVDGATLASGLVLDPQYSASAFRLNSFPEVSLNSATIVEGNAGVQQLVFDVALTTDVGYDLQFDFRSSDSFAAAGTDYVAVDDTLMIAAGNTTATIAVDILGDPALERDEWFMLSILNPVQVALGDVVASGTILNDDSVPALEIADVSRFEPLAGAAPLTFPIGLSAPAPDPVDFSYATADGTAVAGADYTTNSGSASIPASATRGLVSDGSDGEFHPTSNVTINLPADGVLHYSSVHIPAGVNVTFNRNASNTPVILLSQNDILIEGTVNVSSSGRFGGPGGGDGGLTADAADGTDGEGLSPGTGGGYMLDFVGSPGGGGGLGTAGLDPTNRVGPLPGSGGPAVPFPEDLNDRGGSGGGGGGGWFKFAALPGGDGGGGGGGLIASSSHGAIVVEGSIFANGSNGGTAFANAFGYGGSGGGGSGGVIDLQADVIEINGNLQTLGGEGGGISTIQPSNPTFSSGAHGGQGYVRLSADELTVGGTIEGELITRELNVTIDVPVDILRDAICESPELFHLQLISPTGALLTDPAGAGQIVDRPRSCRGGEIDVNGGNIAFPERTGPLRGASIRTSIDSISAAAGNPPRQTRTTLTLLMTPSTHRSDARSERARGRAQDVEQPPWALFVDEFFAQN